MYLIVTPDEIIDKDKGYKTVDGPICIKTTFGLAYLAFKTKKLAEYCKNLYNIEATIEKITKVKFNPESEIYKALIFPSKEIYEQFRQDKLNFNYSNYIIDLNQIINK